ncbi:hypothetical protein [Ferrimonas marina]|uniref:Uncharacterized protein n=2 Tax=Ferrimonas marina TaxID=299255 RepID=A0A1M5SBU1_9GAMM|nr:hypothetical protein [Ferrimonas marina]SHH36057.1 hypothetical protein SAMN02745129_1948 [Ferrimonas marina]
MSAMLILSSALVLLPLSPEPVTVDSASLHQQVNQGLQQDREELYHSFESMELGTPLLLAQEQDSDDKESAE